MASISKMMEMYMVDNGAYPAVSGGGSYAMYLRSNSKPNCKRGVNVSTGWWGASLPTC